jgi:hypothetical protein
MKAPVRDKECTFCGFAARRARAGEGAVMGGLAVMPRLDRGSQYSAALALYSAHQLRVLEYWIARSSRATTDQVVRHPQNQKAGSRPAAFGKSIALGARAELSAPPGLIGYFFFDFLAFFAFFAFFAFLAIASSFELMDGNATRGMLGGGPASQHPRM